MLGTMRGSAKMCYLKCVLLKRCGIEKVCCPKGELFYKRCVTVKGLIFLKVCYLPKYVKLRNLGSEKVSYPKGM